MPSISSSSRITAKFSLIAPGQTKPSSTNVTESNYEQFYQPVYAKFHIDNETLSQVKFQILSPNYKLSLLKEKVETGKYFCNYDQQHHQQQHPPPPMQPQSQNQQQPQPQPQQQQQPQLPIIKATETLTSPSEEISLPIPPPPVTTTTPQRKTPAAGSLSTHIGSTVDVFLNY
jgi:hypothetical protein